MKGYLILKGGELWSIISPDFWKNIDRGKILKEGECLVNVIEENGFKIKQYLKRTETKKKGFLGLWAKTETVYYSYVDVLKLDKPLYTEKVNILENPKKVDYCTYWVEADPCGFRPYDPLEFMNRQGESVKIGILISPYSIYYTEEKLKPVMEKYSKNGKTYTELYHIVDKIARITSVDLDGEKLVFYLDKFKLPVVMHKTSVLEKGDLVDIIGLPIGWKL